MSKPSRTALMTDALHAIELHGVLSPHYNAEKLIVALRAATTPAERLDAVARCETCSGHAAAYRAAFSSGGKA